MKHADDLDHLAGCARCRQRFAGKTLPTDSGERLARKREFIAAAARLERERNDARWAEGPAQRAAAVDSLEISPATADIRRDPIWYAFYLVSLGQRDRALDELEVYAVKHNSAFAAWLWNRGFDPLRDAPRFKAVLAKLALPYTPSAATER